MFWWEEVGVEGVRQKDWETNSKRYNGGLREEEEKKGGRKGGGG